MNEIRRWAKGFRWIIPLLAATLACALPGLGSISATSQPTGGIAPTAEEAGGASSPTAPAAPVGSSGEGAPVDLCALATPAEVQAVLGGPAKSAVFDADNQNCALFLDQSKFLIVQAGHEADGKALFLRGTDGLRGRIKDQAALQLLDQLKGQAASLSLWDLVDKALPIWQAAGYTADSVDGVGDRAAWFWIESATLGKFGELGAGRLNGKWVAVYTVAADEASAKALLTPLAGTLLDRLPDNFTVSGKGF